MCDVYVGTRVWLRMKFVLGPGRVVHGAPARILAPGHAGAHAPLPQGRLWWARLCPPLRVQGGRVIDVVPAWDAHLAAGPPDQAGPGARAA